MCFIFPVFSPNTFKSFCSLECTCWYSNVIHCAHTELMRFFDSHIINYCTKNMNTNVRSIYCFNQLTGRHSVLFGFVIFHCRYLHVYVGPVAQSVQRLTTSWTVRGSNPGGGESFRTCPDRPWGPPSLLNKGYRVFPGSKERPGRDADPSPPYSAVVMKGQSYISTPPMGRTACTEPQCLYKGDLYLQLTAVLCSLFSVRCKFQFQDLCVCVSCPEQITGFDCRPAHMRL